MFDAAIVFAGCLRPSIYDQVTAHTLPCLSKRRDLCSMIDFIKKKKTLLSSHALLLKPNCQILSNLVKIIHCQIWSNEANRAGLASRAQSCTLSGAGERENERQDGNQRPSIEQIPATFARCCQLIVANRWLRPPRDQANCSSSSEGLPGCNERGWATDATR